MQPMVALAQELERRGHQPVMVLSQGHCAWVQAEFPRCEMTNGEGKKHTHIMEVHIHVRIAAQWSVTSLNEQQEPRFLLNNL